MKAQTDHINDLYYEQAAVDELPGKVLDRLKEQPSFSAEEFERRVGELREENRQFHRRKDSRKILEAIRSRAFADAHDENRVSVFADEFKRRDDASDAAPRQSKFRIAGMPRWGAALAAALPVFLAIGIIMRMGIPAGPEIPGDIEPGIRTKGLEPRIFVYRDMGDGQAELLQDSTQVQENDRLQISYLAAGMNYGAILSIDGSSVITLHYPENSNMLPRLQPRDEVYLPYGYLLDDAPDFERFFFVTSNEAFDVRELMASLTPQLRSNAWAEQGTLEIPGDFKVHRINLVKPRAQR